MPKINAPTVIEHRELRRADLLVAATALIRSGKAFTVAEVATQVGLSRSAVYEYYSSAADLIADVIVDELDSWAITLRTATTGIEDPNSLVDAWVTSVLTYVADGQHSLLKSAASIELPPARRAQVGAMHADLISPLMTALSGLGSPNPTQLAHYIWETVQASIDRIETTGCDPVDEIQAVLNFIHGGLASCGSNASPGSPTPSE